MTAGDDRDTLGDESAGETPESINGASRPEDTTRSETQDAWKQVTNEFADLGARLGRFFSETDNGTKDQATEAITDLIEAAQRAARDMGAAWTDEEVQTKAKRAVSSLVDAVGASLKDITAADTPPKESEDQT